MTQQPAPRVFISYSHDSLAHAARVLELTNALRRDGVNATIDQYFTSPPEGWPAWMDAHVRDDDFVVMVCTETYYRRVVRKETPGIGLGVRWEGGLIYNHLYKSDLSRFVPVLLNGGKLDYIPEPVAGATHYLVDTTGGYESLLRRLFNRPTAKMPPIGEQPELPPLPAQWTASPLAELHNVPELPPHFLPRPDAFEGLKSKLLGPAGGAVAVTGVTTRIGVQGMGGIGKSVLAAAVVHDDEVRSAFPAGIFWISLGQMPDVLIRQADLYWLLTREKGGFADAQQGRIALQETLRGRICLVVLDDVWRLADAEAFNVVDADARLLLTTRDAAIVKGIGAREYEVDRLNRSASRLLLAQTAGIAAESVPAEADAIAEECDDLPLALALAGGMIESRADMWSPVLEALRMADWEQINRDFAGYPYPGVFSAIEVSVNALGAERERYLDLAIFPEDVPVPEAALKTLWVDLNPLQVRTLVTRFRDRSLARLDTDNRLTLHDLQRDFVRKRASNLAARHQQLVEAYRSYCPNGWAGGPNDGYFFRFLFHHLAAAGRRNELKVLLADYDWFDAKLKATDIRSVISDYALVANDPDLSRMKKRFENALGKFVARSTQRERLALQKRDHEDLLGIKQQQLIYEKEISQELRAMGAKFEGDLKRFEMGENRNHEDILRLKQQQLIREKEINHKLRIVKVKFEGDLKRFEMGQEHRKTEFSEFLDSLEEIKERLLKYYAELPRPVALMFYLQAARLLLEAWDNPDTRERLKQQTNFMELMLAASSDLQKKTRLPEDTLKLLEVDIP